MSNLFSTILLACIFHLGIDVSATEAPSTSSPTGSTVQFTDRAKDDSLEILRNQMVEVSTWVFDHNGLFGEVDRGNVSWTFADSGALTVTDSDETYTRTYSLTKRCGGYGKIGGGNKAYLKIKSSGDLEECYIVNDLVEVGPPEKKSLLLSNNLGNSLYLIPAE